MEDDRVTISELKKDVKKFNDDRDWDQFHNAKDLGMAISVEAAEVLEHFIYKSPEQVEALFKGSKRVEVEDEVADVFWAVLMLCEKYDIDLSDAFRKKVAKTALKYPIEKSWGNNTKYTEL